MHLKNTFLIAFLSLSVGIAPASAIAADAASQQDRRAIASSLVMKIDSVTFVRGIRFDFAKAVFAKASSAGYAMPVPIYLPILAVALPFAAIGAVMDLLASPFRRTEMCMGTATGTLHVNSEPLRGEDVWIGVPSPDTVDDRKWLFQQAHIAKTDENGKFALPFDLRFGSKKTKTLELRSLGFPVRELNFKIAGNVILYADSEPYESPPEPNQRIWSK